MVDENVELELLVLVQKSRVGKIRFDPWFEGFTVIIIIATQQYIVRFVVCCVRTYICVYEYMMRVFVW